MKASQTIPHSCAEVPHRELSLAFDATAEIECLVEMLRHELAESDEVLGHGAGTKLHSLAKSIRRLNSVAMSISTREDRDFDEMYREVHDMAPSEQEANHG